jgi:hypothetical protein
VSETLYVYTVPTAKLVALPGSRDAELIARIGREYPLIDQVEDMIDESNDLAGDDEIEIGFMDAVERIVNGEPLIGADDSFVYGFAYDAICRALGRPLTCAVLFDIPTADAVLAEMAIPLRWSDLCDAGPLIPLPEPGELPSLGRWTAKQWAMAKAPVHQAKWDETDRTAGAFVRTLRDWYRVVSDGEAVIGILY